MRHRCSATDIAQLLDHLSHDQRQGPQLAREIREGGVAVLRGDITRGVDLGMLKQWWRTKPEPPARGVVPSAHLIVQNSVEGLRGWNTDEGREHVWRIRQRMDELQDGNKPKPLILGWDRGEWVLLDGNYTAAALFHNWVSHPPNPIRVYALRPITWSPTLLPAALASARM